MDVKITIPKEFENDFTADRFKDFFERVITDIADAGYICGRYERETAGMLETAFERAEIL